jgi:hypothetical protein
LRALFLSAIALGATGCESCSKQTPGAADAAAAPASAGRPADAGPVNVTPVPTASIAAMVNPQNLPAYEGPTGSVEGTITVTGPPAPESAAISKDYGKCPDGAAFYGREFREGEPTAPGGPRWLADAVVAVTGYSGFYVPEKEEAEPLAITGCVFEKRTVTMTFGQRLDVRNLTKEFWTPQLQPAQTGVMMMAAPKGDPVHLYPRKPGRYLLIDHDRKYAVADLYAFLHPLHTTSGASGKYRIDGVPVGKLRVNTSHPRIPGTEASADVEIQPGVVQKVDLTLTHVPRSDGGAPDARKGDAGAPAVH